MGGSRCKERANALATRQAARLAYAQLRGAGLSGRQIERALQRGDLTRRLPRVYALGPVIDTREARLWEAVLYAGPGACLTGASGAHQRGLLEFPSRVIHVATPRKVRSLPGIRVDARRDHARERVGALPVAPVDVVLLDLAATEAFGLVRHALAELDYRSALGPAALAALARSCRSGRHGSRELRRALAHHQPELAHTRSVLELDFLLWLERQGLPIPKFNRMRHGVTPDAVWDELKLVVELDGHGNHHSPAQLARDSANQATLEAHGYTVLRFTWHDIQHRPDAVRALLAAHGLRTER